MSLWSQAKIAAENTPAYRNRAADFFRAASILVVVFGHWMVSVPHFVNGGLEFTKLLAVQPWTQYASWVVQVMPIFFFVGGYSNAASWKSARKNPEKRRSWQATRLRRLLLPTAPLVMIWAISAGVAWAAGLDAGIIQAASRAALVPVWFLAVYIMATVVAPITIRAWERYGLYSVALPVVASALVDLIAFSAGIGWLRWTNYAFVWLAMHQLGYWWNGGIRSLAAPFLLAALGAFSLILLVGPLGYPVAMVSVPGEEMSNTRPPTFAMLSIGFTQAGLILLSSGKVADWLQDAKRWAFVILIGQRIMTIYLWHLSTLIAVVGLSLLADGYGLRVFPGSVEWWLTRPLWLAILFVALFPFILIFGGIESASRESERTLPGPVQAALGACLACGGLTFLALKGSYAANALGVNIIPVALTITGVALSSIGRRA
ncbi:acyltransferase [Ostreiculturibacter nitratireducens]|uniref:acyltransferase family protein n=1 Tax=Ostreiculturibacter nitratireducens TaxID=3075226 RepID=UPI0031B5AE6C